MYRVFGECRGNANAAPRLYRERCRGRRHSTANIIRRLDQRALESEKIMPGQGVIYGRKPYRRTPQVEERFLQMFARNPTLSSCTAGRRQGVSHSLVLTILHGDDYPYRYSTINHLIKGDRLHHLEYCQRMLKSLHNDRDFVGHILWTD
ncbi:hypothetical protein PR048_005260 [Dryococelus australis]|uniref:DUF4817 domain-containing protein n=1 Tax=Dryococelus australis TaxID=614101 RepID=A0ABQ9I7R8_9NEOP|nr:hypothetical protein PR048_005260 [Dryococelus australis]